MAAKKKTKDPSRVHAGKKGKRKGDHFEREIAVDLNRRYAPDSLTGRIQDRPFRRTPLSGGFRRANPADLIVPDWFPFFIECKHRQDIGPASSIFHLLENSEKNALLSIWRSELPKARQDQRALLLVFKRTSCLPLCMLETKMLERVDPGLVSGKTDHRDMALRLRQQSLDVTVVTWAALLRRAERELLEMLRVYLVEGDAGVRAEMTKRKYAGATAPAPSSPAP